ncbi:MAG: hypothetical protein K6D94_12830 [Clostridiales bacterium]|nr:hypothetical protein [Clostridiales bacterium]
MRYYLGIDGGGSKTTAVLCDSRSREISRFVGKELNYNSIGLASARENLKEITEAVLSGIGVMPDAVCIGLSALSERADESIVKEFCGGILPCERVLLDSDLFIALEAMETDGPAAVAIAGTGSMVAGRLADGKIIHTGGFGHILGDEGSGYILALEAIRAAVRGAERSGPQTLLSEALFSHFGVKTADDLIGLFYDPPIDRKRLASFAPEVFRCSHDGDGVASQVVSNQVMLFADTARALLRQLPPGTPLGLWGGVFEHQPSYVSLFSDIIKSEFPQTNIGLLDRQPVWGAVRAAIRFDETSCGVAKQ